MKELSLHVLDIVENSIRAKASLVTTRVEENTGEDSLVITVEDDGCGMSEEMVARVTDPFTTSRTTRKVGLGVPLFKAAAELTGGSFCIESKLGVGTKTTARFVRSSIDRQPLGDMAGTMMSLMTANTDVDFVYVHTLDEKEFEVDTRQLKQLLDGVPLNEPEISSWLLGFLSEGEAELTEN